METIGYIYNRHFMLVAVNTRYETELEGIKVVMPNAKKVYKLNDENLISIIGNPYKITDVYKYIVTLSEISTDNTFDEIREDLNDVFNNSKADLTSNLKKLSQLLPRFYDENGYVKMHELLDHLKDAPELIVILNDTLSSINNSHPGLTQIFLLGWDKAQSMMKTAHLVSLGQNIETTPPANLLPDYIYIKLASSTLETATLSKLEAEAILQFKELLTPGWDNDNIDVIIEKGKEVLINEMRKINPYESEPNVVFYELSHRTDFKIMEPPGDFTKISYTRN